MARIQGIDIPVESDGESGEVRTGPSGLAKQIMARKGKDEKELAAYGGFAHIEV